MTGNSTILVTGGAGFIGSHTILELLNNNYTVIALDNLVNCPSSSKDFKPLSLERVEEITKKSITFYNTDITDKEKLSKIFRLYNINVVIHLAALKYISESKKIPLRYYHTNIVGSCTLFQVMRDHNVKKLVFPSSSNIYGVPQFLPVTEEHPTGQRCTSPYSKSKYFVEEILKDICIADSEWSVVSLRYFTPSGAHESGLLGEDPVGVSNNLFTQIGQVAVGNREVVNVLRSEDATSDGSSIRDYIHITDIAIGHILAITKIVDTDFRGWVAYNLGTECSYSSLEIIHIFSKLTGKDIKHNIQEAKKSDIVNIFADATKAKKELKWSALRNVNDICMSTWNWHSQNLNGYHN